MLLYMQRNQEATKEHSCKTKIYCNFFPFAVNLTGTGLLQSQRATNANQPVTVTAMPPIQGQAALISQERGNSSCAKCRTVTVFFSSMLERKGRL